MPGIRLIVKLNTSKGDDQSFVDAWLPHLAEVSEEEGCLEFDLFRSVTNPEELVLVEQWGSAELLMTHVKREWGQPGGPGVPSVNELVTSVVGPEIYDYQLSTLDTDGWRPVA